MTGRRQRLALAGGKPDALKAREVGDDPQASPDFNTEPADSEDNGTEPSKRPKTGKDDDVLNIGAIVDLSTSSTPAVLGANVDTTTERNDSSQAASTSVPPPEQTRALTTDVANTSALTATTPARRTPATDADITSSPVAPTPTLHPTTTTDPTRTPTVSAAGPSGTTTKTPAAPTPKPTAMPEDVKVMTIYACSTAGPSEKAGARNRTWSLLPCSVGIYLIGIKISPEPMINTLVALVLMDEALRKRLHALDRDNTPPGLGYLVCFTGLNPLNIERTNMARVLGKLRMNAFEPAKGADIVKIEHVKTLPYIMVDEAAVRPANLSAADEVLPVTQPNATGLAIIYLAVVFKAVRTTNVHKICAVVLGRRNTAAATTDGWVWVPVDLVLTTINSTTPFNDTLADALTTASYARELIMFAGKHPQPNKSGNYDPQVYLDGAVIARVHPKAPRYGEYLKAGREAATKIDGPMLMDMLGTFELPNPDIRSLQEAAADWDAAINAAAAPTADSVPNGAYAAITFRVIAPSCFNIGGANVLPLAIRIGSTSALAYIASGDVLRNLTPLAEAGVQLESLSAAVLDYCVETWPYPFTATVSIERNGAFLAITQLTLDDATV